MNEPDNAGRPGRQLPKPGLSDRVRSLRLGEGAGRPPSRTRFLPWIVVVRAAADDDGVRLPRPTASARCPARPTVESPTPGVPRRRPSVIRVRPSSSVSAAAEVVLQSKGYVIAMSLVQVSPKVGGQLAWINPDLIEGQPFEVGDVLAVVENTDYLADFDQARAGWRAARQRRIEVQRTMPEEIEQAEADLDETRQTATQLKFDLERNKRPDRSGNAVGPAARWSWRSTPTTRHGARSKRLESTLRLIDARADWRRADGDPRGGQLAGRGDAGQGRHSAGSGPR